ncbi:MAG: sortase [Dehalococcoidia bacterium]|nr:sortase [Dehalococcoidia bacterium]
MILTRRNVLRSFANILVGTGFLMLVLVGAAYAYTMFTGGQVQPRILVEPLRLLPPVPENARVSPVLLPPATRIVIPRIGVDSPVVEIGIKLEKGEWLWETADHAVGHHQGSPNPGEVGNMVMSGHIGSPIRGEGEVFKHLPDILPGDAVLIFTDDTEYLYEVKETRLVLPDEIEVMAPTPDQSLTLITCYPDFIYSHRFIAVAKPYQDIAPAVAPAIAR